jgi:basic membrane protein A and related proteins
MSEGDGMAKSGVRWLALGAACALLVAGCSSAAPTESSPESGPTESSSESPSATEASEPCADPETFCVGLVLESGFVDDGAFNEAAWEGVRDGAIATDAVVTYLESTDASSYAANLDDLGSSAYDVVVTTGVDRPGLTVDAATAHPQTRYIGISQDMSGGPANAIGLLFADDEAGYLAGYLAGLMTQTGTVGAVLGSESVVPLKRFGEGYRLGALAARPDATVIMSYNNDSADSFNDPQWGATAAADQIADGADVIFGAGGTTGIAALETVAQSPGAGTTLFCIGIDVDQYETVPQARPCLLSSAEKLISEGVSALILDIHAGADVGQNVEGEVGLAPYHDMASRVPESVKLRMAEIEAGLSDGSITTGVTF